MTYKNFLVHVREMAAGCNPEAIPRWRDFARECVESRQFVHFRRTVDKNVAVEEWLDAICMGFQTVREECGPETATTLVDLGLERRCLYPGEMMQAALCLKYGENAKQIFNKIDSGEIVCIDIFKTISRREAEGRRSVVERLKSPKKRNGQGKDRVR